MNSISLGIYEKALPDNINFCEKFSLAKNLGFSFMDISIDESDKRINRLYQPKAEHLRISAEARALNLTLSGVCLSAHRLFSLGSPIREHELKAKDLLFKCIDYAYNVGAQIVQIAGYYTFYDAHDVRSRERFILNLSRGVSYAARKGILLGIENVDGEDITNLSVLMQVINRINSPWLQAYPDIGNSAFNGENVTNELRAAEGRIIALHVKDVLPGQPRRIPFGQGITDFDGAFTELSRQEWSGRIMIEMWNDDVQTAESECEMAKNFIVDKLNKHKFEVSSTV